MDRQESLNYLMEKRRLTAPVSQAESNLRSAQNNHKQVTEKFSKLIIGLGIFVVILLLSLWNRFTLSGFIWLFFVVGALIAILSYKKNIISLAENELKIAQEQHNTEISNPTYIEGKKGFPAQFYNYHDCYKLYKLVEEQRADNVKEAYNLLESQQYNETMLSKQDEMIALQQDIAATSAVAATASTVSAAASVATAMNTSKTKKILGEWDRRLR